jgi:hypothetical protein
MRKEMTNPAETKKKFTLPENYQPMSAGTPRLDVPEREGYQRRWFRGDVGRVQRAMQAGWTFVDTSDVKLNNFDLGGDAKASGNTDLGTRVSVISGDEADSTGQPSRMYLMECPDELYEYGRSFLEDRNESVAEALRGGKIGAGNDGETRKDQSNRYVKGEVPDLFNPNKRRT